MLGGSPKPTFSECNMKEIDRINSQANELKAETEKLAKRNDNIYHIIAVVIAVTALVIALFK